MGQEAGEFEQDLLEELAEGWLSLGIAQLQGEEPDRMVRLREVHRGHKHVETGMTSFHYLSFEVDDQRAPTVAGPSYPAPKGLKDRVLEAEMKKRGLPHPSLLDLPGVPTPAAVRSWKYPNWSWVRPGTVLKPQRGRAEAVLTLRGADPRWVGEDVRVMVREFTPNELGVNVDVVSLGDTHPWGAVIQIPDLMGEWEETREAPEWAKPGTWVRLKNSTGTVRRVAMVTGDLVRIEDDCGPAYIMVGDWEPLPTGTKPGGNKDLFPAWAQMGAMIVPRDLGSPWRGTLRGFSKKVSSAVVEIRDRTGGRVYGDVLDGKVRHNSAASIDCKDLENFWMPQKPDQVPLSGEDIGQAVKESWELPTWAQPGKWIKREDEGRCPSRESTGKSVYEVIGKNGDGTFSAWEYDMEGGDPMLLPATKTTTSIKCLDRWVPAGDPGPSWQKRMSRAMRATGAQLRLREQAAMPKADLNRNWPVVVLAEERSGVLVAPVGRHRESFEIPDSEFRTDWRLACMAPGSKAFGQKKPELPAGLKAGRRVRLRAGVRAGKVWEDMKYAVVQAVDGDWAIRLVGCAPYQDHKMTSNLGAFLADWELLPEEGLPVWVQPGMKVRLKEGERSPEYWPPCPLNTPMTVVGLLPHGGVELKGPEGLPLNLHPEYVARAWEPVFPSNPDWLKPGVGVRVRAGFKGIDQMVGFRTGVVKDVRGLLAMEVVVEGESHRATYELLDFLETWEPAPLVRPNWVNMGVLVRLKERHPVPRDWASGHWAVVEGVTAGNDCTKVHLQGREPYQSQRLMVNLGTFVDDWEPVAFPPEVKPGVRLRTRGHVSSNQYFGSVGRVDQVYNASPYPYVLGAWVEPPKGTFTITLNQYLGDWEVVPEEPAVSGSVPKMPRQWTKEQLAMSCVDAKLRLKAGAPVPWHGLAHHMDIVRVIGAKSVGYVTVKAGSSKPFDLDPDTLFRDWELWFEAPYDKPLPSWVKVGRLMRCKASPSMVYGISSVEGGRVLAWATPDGPLEEVVNLWCEWEPLEKAEPTAEGGRGSWVGFPEWVKAGALLRVMGQVDPERYLGKRAIVDTVKNQGKESFLRVRYQAPPWAETTLSLVQFDQDWEYDPEFPEGVQPGLLIHRKDEATRVAKISEVYNRPSSPYKPYLRARWEKGGGEVTLLRDVYLAEWELVRPPNLLTKPDWIIPDADIRLKESGEGPSGILWEGVREARIEEVMGMVSPEVQLRGPVSQRTTLPILDIMDNWEPAPFREYPEWIKPGVKIREKVTYQGLWAEVTEVNRAPGWTVSPQPFAICRRGSEIFRLDLEKLVEYWEVVQEEIRFPEWVYPRVRMRQRGLPGTDVEIVRVTYAPTGSLTIRNLKGKVSELYLGAFLDGGWEPVSWNEGRVPKARVRKVKKAPVPVKPRKRSVKKRKS